ncbi:GRB2-associated-binding protein 1 [Cimex lectularius]|uniref:PH domain-containing protein n=1 Tax=Cimex lectularius TaxID=79782 RepID=A0A8I6SBX3_CIMLE|nr:GRB2-associated-binding protein 1 [Cimex lectularius]
MPNKQDNLEIVHEGWLTKSPPAKRIWRARWRRRWFVLRHSGELPDQYFLFYYTDKNCRTLKGQIDLDQCEQVDAGLQFESSKHKYRYMFDVRTPKRTYYLAAETEEDMNKWVECVCHVCGLKAYTQEENVCPFGSEESSSLAEELSQVAESPPVSPSSTASGPYIPISECITGKPLVHNNYNDEFYDSPRRLQPPGDLELRGSLSATPPLQSPGTDVESVFTDEEWPNQRPSVNWDTFPHPSDSSVEDVKPSLIVGKRRYTKPEAPPHPPKPQHLVLHDANDIHTYSNLDEPVQNEVTHSTENVINEMYDFPRSHHLNGEQENIDPVPAPRSRHWYTNAAPSQVGTVFRYDFAYNDEPASPHSEASSAQYSNVSSPLYSGNPPAVNRGLKPGRKTSESISNEPSPLQPNVDLNLLRNLKPSASARAKDDHVPLKLSAPPRRNDYSKNTRIHSGHSPTLLPFTENSDADTSPESHEQALENACFSAFAPMSIRGGKQKEIQYLDLDLDTLDSTNPSTSESSNTVYKEVDFVKTEAFNRTRQRVEEERKNGPDNVL